MITRPKNGLVYILTSEDGRKRWWCRECGATNQGIYLKNMPDDEMLRLADGHVRRQHKKGKK